MKESDAPFPETEDVLLPDSEDLTHGSPNTQSVRDNPLLEFNPELEDTMPPESDSEDLTCGPSCGTRSNCDDPRTPLESDPESEDAMLPGSDSEALVHGSCDARCDSDDPPLESDLESDDVIPTESESEARTHSSSDKQSDCDDPPVDRVRPGIG